MDNFVMGVLGASVVGLISYTFFGNIVQEEVGRRGQPKRRRKLDKDLDTLSASDEESSDEERAGDSDSDSAEDSNEDNGSENSEDVSEEGTSDGDDDEDDEDNTSNASSE